MYIAALIGSICSFICSFVPLFGIPFSIVFSVTGIVFSILVLKKANEKERKDASIIALIISILAIIICIFVNIMSMKFIIGVFRNFPVLNPIDYESYYEEKFENYTNQDKNDNILLTDKIVLKINNITKDKNKYSIGITVQALDDDTYFSIYNFGLYDSKKEQILYALPTVINNKFISGALQEGESKDITLEFKLSSKNTEQLYLIYMNSEDGVKIKL